MRPLILVSVWLWLLPWSRLEAQATAAEHADRGWFGLYELVLGASLGRSLSEGSEYSPAYLAAELGPMLRRGDHAWGGALFAGGGPCFTGDCVWRLGARGRYRRWLGEATTLDLGLGPLCANGRPGAGALVTVSYRSWLGVTLHYEAIAAKDQGEDYDYAPVRSELLLGARFGGKAGVVGSVALVLLGAVFAASWQSW